MPYGGQYIPHLSQIPHLPQVYSKVCTVPPPGSAATMRSVAGYSIVLTQPRVLPHFNQRGQDALLHQQMRGSATRQPWAVRSRCTSPALPALPERDLLRVPFSNSGAPQIVLSYYNCLNFPISRDLRCCRKTWAIAKLKPCLASQV